MQELFRGDFKSRKPDFDAAPLWLLGLCHFQKQGTGRLWDRHRIPRVRPKWHSHLSRGDITAAPAGFRAVQSLEALMPFVDIFEHFEAF